MTELEIRNSMDDKVDKAIKEDGQKTCKVIYSAYKTNKNDVPIDNLHKIAKKGKIILISKADDFWGGKKSKDYRSEVLENPTWLQICVCANKMITITRDEHHVFLEGIYYFKKENDVSIYEFAMGS